MRMRIAPEMSFTELLGHVRHTALDAYRYQDIPFERIVEELAPERSRSTTPLFHIVFSYQNAPWQAELLQGLEIEPVRGDLRVHFDLTVHAHERDGQVALNWVYNPDLFDHWRIEQMADHYVRVLEDVAGYEA
jgi:non-ribosomal peptide synthetase component F